jgi:peptidoglycan hydrolase-like protein with peptidoglycan-binding domain
MSFGRGEQGYGVQELQEKLDKWIQHHKGTATDTGLIGFPPDFRDGIFGENTQTALAMYQQRNGLGSSGFADAATLRGLGLDETLTADGSTATVPMIGGS